jgi:hypothetical protein
MQTVSRNGFGGEQGGAFEHPAKVLFAGVLVLATAALEAREGFVTDSQPFQMHDADVVLAALPNLPLLEFHASTVVFQRRCGER